MDEIQQRKLELERMLKAAEEKGRNTDESIKSEDKQSKGKFVRTMIVAGLIGGLVGGFIGAIMGAFGTPTGDKFILSFASVQRDIADICCYIFLGVTIALSIVLFLSLHQVRKAYRNWDKEDEKEALRLEDMLNFRSIVTIFGNLLTFLLYGAATYCMLSKDREGLLILLLVIFLLWDVLFMIYIQKEILNLIKRIRTEKKGSVYDCNMKEKWLDSCDEAEKMVIYEASYETYTKMSKYLKYIIAVIMMAGAFIEIGLLPLLLVIAIDVMQTLLYYREAKKREDKGRID